MPIRTLELGATEEKDVGWGVFPLPPGIGEEPLVTIEIQPTPVGERAKLPTSIASLLDDRLRLRSPVDLELEQEGGFHIAKCQEFEEFGYGKSPMEAVDDLRLTLAELYWTLKEEQAQLGPSLRDLWQRLNEKVEAIKET